MNSSSRRQIIIIGGFMSIPRHYEGMAATLQSLTKLKVSIAPLDFGDWLKIRTRGGWRRLLVKTLANLQTVVDSGADEIIIVAHSLGGIVARLLLSGDSVLDTDCRLRHRVVAVITLGTPHQYGIVSGLLRWHRLRAVIQSPSQPIPLLTVAGRIEVGALKARRRVMSRLRHSLHGAPAAGDGDGVIPVSAALLQRESGLLLEGVFHDSHIGRPWFGDPEIVPRWWAVFADRCLNTGPQKVTS